MDENVPQSTKEAAIAEAYAAYLIALASRRRLVDVRTPEKQAGLGIPPQSITQSPSADFP